MPDIPSSIAILRAFEPRDITRITWVSDPRVSPDGARVAFVATTLSEEKDEYLSAIWVVETAPGSTPRRFTFGAKRDSQPRWSPDGTRLAFIGEREAKKRPQLYVMPADGGEAVCITDIKRGVTGPVWSPDGTRIAFVSKTGGWDEPESEEEKAKSKPARVIDGLKYKLNGEGFIHDRHAHLFVIDAGGAGTPRQITDGDFQDGNPAWAPDGTRIAFASARHATRDQDNAGDIFVVAVDREGEAGGEGVNPPVRVTDTAGPAGYPSWSPDGMTIAFLGERVKNEAGRNTRIFLVPAAGGATPVCITDTVDRTVEPIGERGPLWTPDGTAVLFASDDRGTVPISRAGVAGESAPVPVIDGERQITGLSMAADGRLVYAATDPLHPAELFIAGPDGAAERRLTDLNAAWRSEVALQAPERFSFERAGFTIDGWVMKPFGWREGERYPALLNVHGGPATQYGLTFFDEFQTYAGAGYAVIFTNPRGSQGYGEAFTRAVVGDWGGGDYADVMAGLEAALARHPWIDPERLGVMGGSYGGYMTSWIVGHDQRFKAACSERALNTFYSMVGSSDIGHFFPEEYGDGSLPWENMDWFLRASPLTYARNITTPLLIMHSEDDLRCPIEQAEQLFVYLKKLGKTVRFIRFPDENHELSRSGRPRHRLERFRYLLEWFGPYLSVATASEAAAAGAGTPAA